MAVNPMAMMKLASSWNKFKENHPKFPAFLQAAQGEIKEGTVLAITVTTQDGRKLESNLKLSASDMELLSELKQIK